MQAISESGAEIVYFGGAVLPAGVYFLPALHDELPDMAVMGPDGLFQDQVLNEVGDSVEAGDPLVTLVCHEVGEAKSEFYKAAADLELAEINLEREKRLLENNIGVRKNFQVVEAAHKVAQSTKEAAEKNKKK